MSTVTLGGNPIKTSGELPKVGTKAPEFQLVKNDLSTTTLSDYAGTKLVLNIFQLPHQLLPFWLPMSSYLVYLLFLLSCMHCEAQVTTSIAALH